MVGGSYRREFTHECVPNKRMHNDREWPSPKELVLSRGDAGRGWVWSSAARVLVKETGLSVMWLADESWRHGLW